MLFFTCCFWYVKSVLITSVVSSPMPLHRLQGFSLQLGSELYLVFDARYRHRLLDLAEEITGTVRMVG